MDQQFFVNISEEGKVCTVKNAISQVILQETFIRCAIGVVRSFVPLAVFLLIDDRRRL